MQIICRRGNHEVVRHPEFLGTVMRKRDEELLELFLDSDPTIPKRLQSWGGVIYPRSAALVRKLLARGLDPNRPDWLGKSIPHACAENGDRSVAAVLLDAGADINARDVEFHGTPLAAAVRAAPPSPGSGPRRNSAEWTKRAERSRRMVEFLLQRGALVNLPGDQPWATPLAWAARHGRGDLVKLLQRGSAP